MEAAVIALGCRREQDGLSIVEFGHGRLRFPVSGDMPLPPALAPTDAIGGAGGGYRGAVSTQFMTVLFTRFGSEVEWFVRVLQRSRADQSSIFNIEDYR